MGEDDEDPLDLFGTNAPYWRQVHGIGHPWQATERGRRGCILMLFLGFALFVGTLLVALIAR